MRKLVFPLVAALIAVSAPSHADDPVHGGQVKKIGAYEGELVVRGADILLYVIKDHKPLKPAASMSASVRLFVNNAESAVDLKPEGDRLAGKAAAPSRGNVRATATLIDNGKEIGKAQYNLNAR